MLSLHPSFRWSVVYGASLALLSLALVSLAHAQDAAVAEKPEEKTEQAEKPKTDDATKQDKPAKSDELTKRQKEWEKRKRERAAKQEKEETKKNKKVRMAQIILSGDMPESPGVMSPFGDMQLDLRATLLRFEQAAKDDDIAGMVLQINNPGLGRGKINELRETIKRFRKSGKKVYAQLEMAMPGDYLIATACDEIVMPESGVLLLPGVRAEAMFYKGLLSKIGVKADFIHMGDAKGAAESITRRKFSKPVRENLTAMIDDLYDHMIETLTSDRPITKEKAVEVVNRGLLTATQAKEAGLVDRIAYSTELRQSLGKSFETKNLVYVQNYGKEKIDTDFSGPTGLFKLLSAMSGGDSGKTSSGKKIAIVYAVGPITTGKSEQDLFGASNMGSTTIIEALREAADDEKVAAIVLRINSPGGSAIASDLMWHQIETIEKPIVASMGDVAASGGYYIAMGCDKILAEPTTITGSIGVVGGKMALGGLYDKVGISIDTISRGENSGVFSSTNKFSKSEREVIVSMMEETYEQFTSKAATGRSMPVEQLKKLAGGRVYTGRQAKANGLIDELGTLNDAIAEAKKLAGIGEDEKVRIESLPEPVDFFDTLFGNTDSEKEVKIKLDLSAISPELQQLAKRASLLNRVFREPVVLMMPFELNVR